MNAAAYSPELPACLQQRYDKLWHTYKPETNVVLSLHICFHYRQKVYFSSSIVSNMLVHAA